MRADEEERKVSQETVIEKKAQEAGGEGNDKSWMARQTEYVTQVSLGSMTLVVAFGLGHPEKSRDTDGDREKINGKRPVPGDGGQESTQWRKKHITYAVQENLESLAADFFIAFKEIANQNDGQRGDGAIGDALKRPKDQKPGKGRSKSHGSTEDTVENKPPCQ